MYMKKQCALWRGSRRENSVTAYWRRTTVLFRESRTHVAIPGFQCTQFRNQGSMPPHRDRHRHTALADHDSSKRTQLEADAACSETALRALVASPFSGADSHHMRNPKRREELQASRTIRHYKWIAPKLAIFLGRPNCHQGFLSGKNCSLINHCLVHIRPP